MIPNNLKVSPLINRNRFRRRKSADQGKKGYGSLIYFHDIIAFGLEFRALSSFDNK